MGNLFQQILNILTSPIGFVLIFGLIGGLGRLGAWLSQERARRVAIQARARQENEALRTGRPVGVTSQTDASSHHAGHHSGAATPPPAEQAAETGDARALQEQRAAQLRALQQKRLAELRAKRMQQAGGTQTPAAPAPQAPRAQTPRAQTPRPQPARDAQRPGRPTDRREQPGQPGTRPGVARSPSTFPSPIPPPARAAQSEPAGRTVFPQQSATPNFNRPSTATGGAGSGFAALLVSQVDLRRAVLLSEVLGPPVSERDPGQTGIF